MVLAVASIGVFMSFLDDTVVGIAFPDMARTFADARLTELSWVLNAYNITFAALMIPAGRFADRFGRRRLYLIGLVLFTLGSGLAAIAPSLEMLIAARALQGMGAAVIVPTSLAIVLDAYEPQRRGQAVAIWSATAAIAAGLGPSVGGVLVDLESWRLVFLINIPIGVAGYVLSTRLLVESRAPGRRLSPDLGGALLLVVAVGALTLAVVQGPEWGWTSAGVLLAGAASLIVSALIAQRTLRRPASVIDVELLRAPRFGITSAITLVGSAGFFAVALTNVLFMIGIWGYSPLEAGLAITPSPFIAALAAGASGPLAARIDPRRLVVAGAVVWTAGPVYLLLTAEADPDFLGAYLPAAALMAVGVGLAFPLVSEAAVGMAPAGRYAGASALNGAIRQIGAAIGVAILAVVLGHADSAATLADYRSAWWFAAGCFAFAAVGSLALAPFRAPDLGDAEELAHRRAAIAAQPRVPRPAPPPRRTDPPTAVDDSPEALLGEVGMFTALSPDARAQVAATATTVRVRSGEWLFRQGDPADALYIVRSGRLTVELEQDGGPAERVNEIGRGTIVGELAMLGDERRSASIRGRRDATLLRIDRAVFESMLADGAFSAAIARALARELQNSRRSDVGALPKSTTLAIVGTASSGAAAVETELANALARLCATATLDERRVAERGHDTDVGAGLAMALDRVERDHELIHLSALGEPRDPWVDACVRMADRVVLLAAEDDAARWSSVTAVHGCDLVILDPAGGAGIAGLREALMPRSTHRVRGPDDVARLARRLSGHAVGLVLSGGGARALAHIGVIEELLAAGVQIDRVGGCSMGAFIAALLAQGVEAEEIEERCYFEFVRRNPLGDYRLPRTSLARGGRARAMVERNFPDLIEDLPRSFYAVSTDILSSRRVVIRTGPQYVAVGTSMTIPGIFAPVPLGPHLLVDGGVLDNLPVAPMVDEDEGPVIAADVTKPPRRPRTDVAQEIGLIDTLTRLMLLSRPEEDHARASADLVITPDHEAIGQLEFFMLDRMRDAGRRAALTALESAPSSLFS